MGGRTATLGLGGVLQTAGWTLSAKPPRLSLCVEVVELATTLLSAVGGSKSPVVDFAGHLSAGKVLAADCYRALSASAKMVMRLIAVSRMSLFLILTKALFSRRP